MVAPVQKHFEVYLNLVADEGLRATLKAEFERTTTEFGLVFERHPPHEGIRMPHSEVRRGRTFIREADGTFHKVRAISGESVTLADEYGNVTEEHLILRWRRPGLMLPKNLGWSFWSRGTALTSIPWR